MKLSSGTDHRDWADARRSLASFCDIDEVLSVVVDLVLDGDDTFVTTETTGALLRRHDSAGWSIVVRACGSADVDQLHHISDEVADILRRPVDQEPFRAACTLFDDGHDELMSAGVARLSEMLDDVAAFYDRANPTA